MRSLTGARGVIAGKFYPPHKGHHHLINTALADCAEVDVLVVDNSDYVIPAQLRRQWLEAEHPGARVHIIPDIGKDDDSVAWAAHAMQFLGYAPDVVYSSEDYGQNWAHYMGAQHVMVDQPRQVVPMSGTIARRDILAAWDYLSDSVRAGLALRVVIVGAESTGTTTLARALADALHVPWVPEVGRFYTESILSDGGAWGNEDFYRIAHLQQSYEAAIAVRSRGVIVCDTNTVATELWQRRYLGETTSHMHEIASKDKVDLYVITGDEIPFVQDGIRDGEHIRHEMHQWFLEHIAATGVPFIVVTGSVEERLAATEQAARDMIERCRVVR